MTNAPPASATGTGSLEFIAFSLQDQADTARQIPQANTVDGGGSLVGSETQTLSFFLLSVQARAREGHQKCSARLSRGLNFGTSRDTEPRRPCAGQY